MRACDRFIPDFVCTKDRLGGTIGEIEVAVLVPRLQIRFALHSGVAFRLLFMKGVDDRPTFKET